MVILTMAEWAKWVLLVQIGSTWAMVGLIWFVQLVHYPLFDRVGREPFERYERDHQRLTARVVGPLMLAEMATAIALAGGCPDRIPAWLPWTALIVLISIWLVTYTVQVPQHAALSAGFDDVTQKRLVAGNWFRTIAWTARGGLVLWITARLIPS
jgi:hypothetical protein